MPGRHVYAQWEFRKKGEVHEKYLGSTSGGRSRFVKTTIREADEDEIEGDAEGMTQLRGEASKDQDKFRVTVEREQVIYGLCDHEREPLFEPGTTSITFTGSHFRMSNVQWPEEVWKERK